MVRGPFCASTKGQHCGDSGEQPTHGYSRRPTPVEVYVAICGIVQDPVRSIWPVNGATGPPIVVANAAIALVTVDADSSLTEVINEVEDAVPAGGFVMIETEVADRGEHPRKSGMLTLYDAQSARSKVSAAVCVVRYRAFYSREFHRIYHFGRRNYTPFLDSKTAH